LVIFIEPLQRLLGRRLQETAHREMDRVQRLSAEIQQEARQGNLERLLGFIERRTKEEFGFGLTAIPRVDPNTAVLRPLAVCEGRKIDMPSSEKYFQIR